MYASILFDIPVARSFLYEIPPEMDVQVGMRVVVRFSRRKKTGYVVKVQKDREGSFRILPVERVVDKEPIFGTGEISLAEWMARFYLCSPGEALSLMIPGGRRDSGMPAFESESVCNTIEKLSFFQQSALDRIEKEPGGMFYLWGVTGSGKSEVFLRAAEHVIAQNKQVIYLVPEISLTGQLASLVVDRFDKRVAILHSALTPSQRLTQWRRIISGKVDLVIGARSAVFAPVPSLGMIVVDEEHENSYKADSTPRYHARQVAQYRCEKTGATLVMGSATPSLEAWRLQKEGKITCLTLPERVAGGTLPQIEIVNMKGQPSELSEQLETRMQDVLSRGRQVVLFLNRRGYSYYFHCRSCGYEMICPNCSVSLTYHSSPSRMVCHYCGYQTKPVKVCPECGSVDVGFSGFGTERVEKAVRDRFPFASVLRLDADTSSNRKEMVREVERFKKGEYDILLGTQMVSKGLNFPRVELVGIVLADSGMNIPDFRSRERVFSLLTQVAGRAGRYDDRGRVVIQTFHPEDPAIEAVRKGDLRGFYEQEMAIREMTGFPPFTRMVNLVIRGRRESTVKAEAERLEALLTALNGGDPRVEILITDACPISKQCNWYRWHILLRSAFPARLHLLVSSAIGQFDAPSTVYIEVDIDPLRLA